MVPLRVLHSEQQLQVASSPFLQLFHFIGTFVDTCSDKRSTFTFLVNVVL